MKATRKQIKVANEIAARFSGWHEPQEIAAMYDELEKIGWPSWETEITTRCGAGQ